MAGCTLFAFGPYTAALDGLSASVAEYTDFHGVFEGQPVLIELATTATQDQGRALAEALGFPSLTHRGGWTMSATSATAIDYLLEEALPIDGDAADLAHDIAILAKAGFTLAYHPG